MSLYEIICEIAQKKKKIEGGGFSDLLTFDLKNKTIRSKKMFLLNKEGIVTQIQLEDGTCYSLKQIPFFDGEIADPYKEVQRLYDDFIFSRPSARTEYSNMNFRCKKSDELTFEQIMQGKDRNEARCALEAFILLGALSGIFEWKHENHWYWKGKNGLVLYKDWVR